ARMSVFEELQEQAGESHAFVVAENKKSDTEVDFDKLDDALLIWRATPRALRGPRGAWRAARALAARLPPGPNVLLILAEIDPLDAYEAAALIGPGRYPAPPGWPQLRGVFVLEAKDGLSEGPSLHALARVVAPRLALGGPEEIDALQRRGYLITAATRGQLGGGLRCEAGACALPDGRARIASGGNAAPYSELELALMGLRPWAGLDEGLARLSMTPEGLRRTGEVTLEAIRAAAPPPPPAWRLGVVWISAKAPSEPEVQRQLRALEAFARPGPDADPLRYNFYEATQGRGRLRLHAWRG
ncbi:hypothetical protein KJ940_18590, partial [Myxococcota bacterium]|nr:hypothetical protein [Myxococcota bacterium]